MEAVPQGIDYRAVERRLAAIDGVAAVHDLHVWQTGSEGRALSAHLLIDGAPEWPRVLEEAREALSREFGVGHVTLQPAWLQFAHTPPRGNERQEHHDNHVHGDDHDHDHEHRRDVNHK
jgi:cobalt-zinc-cadmium efflux system protein